MHWYLLTVLFVFDSVFFKTTIAYNIGSRLRREDKSDGSEEDLKTFQKQVLDSHNKYREQHCVPALVLDDDINRSAQNYAKTLVTLGTLAHSTNRVNLGENLYAIGSSQPVKNFNGTTPTNAWYNEIKDYSFNAQGFSSKTGHFTQVVWKNTQKLGVGLAFTDDKRKAYVVAQYSPPGNVMTKFADNVLPLGC